MSESPYELHPLVTVATFSTPWEAHVAQARLAAERISALIADEHVIRMVALSSAVGGYRLQVCDVDAANAAEVLRRVAPLPEIYLVPPQEPAGDAPPAPRPAAERVCPGCGGTDLQVERSSRLMLGILPLPSRAWRCGDCGVLWKGDEVESARTTAAHALLPDPLDAVPDAAAGDEEAEDALSSSSLSPLSPLAPLSTVARFHTPWEAHLARTLLESEEIRACVFEERLPAVNLLSAEPVAFNRLAVHEADAARAAAILARAWSCQPLTAVPDPDPAAEG